MIGRDIRTAICIAGIEYKSLLRSSKMIVLGLFVIFANILIVMPLKECAVLMQRKLSFWEPFTAAGNSGIIVLLLPLFYLVMMADFPRQGDFSIFYQFRCKKRVWVSGQICFAVLSSVSLALFTMAVTMLLLLPYGKWSMKFSRAVTHYAAEFPERADDYVVQLLPQNLYNQMTLGKAVKDTFLLLVLYFLLLALILLLFSLCNKKILGILADGFLVATGAVMCAARVSYMWIFPMSHTITWLHYTEYLRKEIFPMAGSYLYFVLINIVLGILCWWTGKRYQAL